MPVSGNTVAYGTVAFVAAVLFSVGTPPSRAAAPPVPATSAPSAIATDAAATGPQAPPAIVQAAGVTLRSVGFDIPTDGGRAFPAGPGAELMAANCVSCHTSGMILNQPALSRADWSGEVAKMVKVYKAPVDDADVPTIVTYLASLKVAP